MTCRPRTAGFTFIEISIVLVIIGLVVGGIVAGKAMIQNAQVRRDISMIDQLRSTVRIFSVRYNALPGDMPNPQRYFTLDVWHSAYSQGNGDGIIGNFFSSDPQSTWIPTIGDSDLSCGFCHETTLFWMELAAAKLVPLAEFGMSLTSPNYQCTPGQGYLALNTDTSLGFGVIGRDTGTNYIVYGVGQHVSYPNNQYIDTAPRHSTTAIAPQVDQKIDDGLPRSGEVQNVVSSAGSDRYGSCSSATSYQPTSTSNECTLRIEGGF